MAGQGFTSGFSFVDHTADLAARLWGRTLDELFGAAAAALTAAITLPERVEPRQSLTIQLEAGDPEQLLVDWAGELLYRFDTDGFLVSDVRPSVVWEHERWTIVAEVAGETRDPARHPIKVLLKAVTYHGLRIERSDDGYQTMLVFDI